MNGVPENLDLTYLHGAELIQVCLGVHQVQFHFHPRGTLSVEGEWDLRDADDTELDRSQPPPRGRAFELHRLLAQRVTDTILSPPRWLGIRFERGELLRVYDSSEQYESFSIGGVFV